MTETMTALMKQKAGNGHVALAERSIPDIAADEVLIEIECCGVCGSDLHIQTGLHHSSPPIILGHEFAGIIAKIGADVTNVDIDDRVAFRRPWHPFPGVDGDGGFAQFMKAPASGVWSYPDGLTAAEASQFETVRPPYTMVRDVADLDHGENVVISGPGPIGLLVANIASIEGAGSITVLGTEEDTHCRLPLAEQLGADRTMIFGDEALEAIEHDPPAIWFETSGAAPAIEAAVSYVAPAGRIVCSGLGSGPWNVDMRRVAERNLTIRGQWGGDSSYVLPAAEAMLDETLDVKSIISDIRPLDEWESAFADARAGRVAKVLLDPR